MSTVLLTGATGGLGRAVTRHLLDAGHRVLATHEPNSTLDKQENLFSYELDLTDEIACRALIGKLATEHGAIDAAVLLVGGFAMGSISETDYAAVEHQINLNFRTTYQVVRPVFDQMAGRPEGGRFVLVGARPALVPEAGQHMVAYALSKSLVIHLSEIINAAGKAKNIVSTVIVPSTIDTPANRQAMPEVDPAKWVAPDDIAELINFVTFGPGSMLRESVLKVYNRA
ncbi:SDR family NAD(P)-dependent oxidoreductase [Larkinella soli]|uniref:SDR family NAD(P)-dependent oxidoreductase n=1 Tax=Larkinella soli TaxID=1770527 RepID=UPI000FFC7E6E|nr:SDR family NAD(P)-dependent oxidoreductase [Larkinella soli]